MKTILRLLLLQTAWISPVVADSVAFTYNSAADVPITASGFTATGNTLDITLNFAPEIGTVLTVVNNVSLNAIGGQFSNLSQGQTVALSFEGVSYKFVANYVGGTGNDLLLRWAENKATAWGNNSSGKLRNKSTTNSRVPIWVTPQDGVRVGCNCQAKVNAVRLQVLDAM